MASRSRSVLAALLLAAVSAAGHGHGSRTSGGGITYSNDYHPNPVSIVRVDRLVLQAAHADSSSSDGGSVSLWAEPCNFSTTGAWTTLSWSGVPNPDVGDFIGPSIPQRRSNGHARPL